MGVQLERIVFGIGLVQVRSKLFVGKPTPKPKSNGTQTCPTQIVNSQPKCNLVGVHSARVRYSIIFGVGLLLKVHEFLKKYMQDIYYNVLSVYNT